MPVTPDWGKITLFGKLIWLIKFNSLEDSLHLYQLSKISFLIMRGGTIFLLIII